MIKKRQIHPSVQQELYRKMDSLDRLRLTEGAVPNHNFFIGGAFEPSDRTNPIEQHLYRSCFAKVSVAVPEKVKDDKGNDSIVHQPIYMSSYMKRDEKNVFQINEPVTFSQGYNESSDNRFRGHSGITKISVNTKEYYTQQYSISWVCPDPQFFEETFEPNFLKLGAYVAIEFGWGINDKGIEVEDLTIEEMKRIIKDGVQERNLKSGGNYQCGVGQVIKFDWKIQDNGSYTGDLQVMSMGASPLLETQKPGKNSDEAKVARLKGLTEKLAVGRQLAKDNLLEESDREELQDVLKEVVKLQSNTVTFNAAMKNLNHVMDSYLGFNPIQGGEGADAAIATTITAVGVASGGGIFSWLTGPTGFAIGATLDFLNVSKGVAAVSNYINESLRDSQHYLGEENNPYAIFHQKFDADKSKAREYKAKDVFRDDFTNEDSRIDYIFQDGVLRIKPQEMTFQRKNDVPEKLKHRYFASWGWFEDIMLASFFSLSSGDTPIQEIKSMSDGELNKCLTHEYISSTGLDSVILPGKQHKILNQGFTDFTDEELKAARYVYPKEQRNNMTRVFHIYKLIDEKFKPFEITGQDQLTSQSSLIHGPNEERIEVNSKGQYYYHPNGDKSKSVIVPRKKATELGIIRNMVFPMEMFQKHFSEMNSLRQGLRNFWSDVTNQYGGFWDFKYGQDVDKTTRIGVSDLNLSDPKQTAGARNRSTREDYYNWKKGQDDPEKIFTFPVYSKQSIVKTFDIDLDLSPEAATLARYGSNSAGSRINGPGGLGIQAWNILNSSETNDNTKEENEKRLKRFKDIEIYKNLAYPTDDGVGLGYTEDYDQTNSESIPQLEDGQGLRFGDIDTVEEDEAKEGERIENDRIQFIKGVGIYDKFGNFSQYFKGTMNYIINSSTEEDSKSLIQMSQAVIPIKLSMELDGIGGLRIGDLFRVDYLPAKYRDYCYFMITKVDHNIGTSGWSTTLNAMMIADMPEFWLVNKDILNGKVDFMKWFKSTTFNLQTFIDSSDNALVGGVQEKIDAFEKQVSDLQWVQKRVKDTTRKWRIFKLEKLTIQANFNRDQMANCLTRLEKQLSAIGDRTFPYNDKDGVLTETTGNKLIEVFRKKQKETLKSLYDDNILTDPTTLSPSGRGNR
jgi:hypothetical protein